MFYPVPQKPQIGLEPDGNALSRTSACDCVRTRKPRRQWTVYRVLLPTNDQSLVFHGRERMARHPVRKFRQYSLPPQSRSRRPNQEREHAISPAKARPTAVFPAPIIPTNTTVFFNFQGPVSDTFGAPLPIFQSILLNDVILHQRPAITTIKQNKNGQAKNVTTNQMADISCNSRIHSHLIGLCLSWSVFRGGFRPALRKRFVRTSYLRLNKFRSFFQWLMPHYPQVRRRSRCPRLTG